MTRLNIYILVSMWFSIPMWRNKIRIHTWESNGINTNQPATTWSRPSLQFFFRKKYQDENKVRVSAKNRPSIFEKINICKEMISKRWLKARLWHWPVSVNQEYKWLLLIVLREFMKLAMIKQLIVNTQTWSRDGGAPILTYIFINYWVEN